MKKIIIILFSILIISSCSETGVNKNLENNTIKKTTIKENKNPSITNIEKETTNQKVDEEIKYNPLTQEDLNILNNINSRESLDFDCNSLKTDEVKKTCFEKKLKNSWNYRHMGMSVRKFGDINCKEKFNKENYPGLEEKVGEYIKKCELEKISEKKKNNKLNEYRIQDCKKTFNGNDSLIQTCEIKVAMQSEKGCESFNNETKKQECIRVEKNLEIFNQMQNDYYRYGQFNIGEYIK